VAVRFDDVGGGVASADGSESWVQVGSGVERGGQEEGPIADRI
jgi:hypothetical protein